MNDDAVEGLRAEKAHHIGGVDLDEPRNQAFRRRFDKRHRDRYAQMAADGPSNDFIRADVPARGDRCEIKVWARRVAHGRNENLS